MYSRVGSQLIHVFAEIEVLTMPPSLLLNSPVNDLTRSTSSQRDALKSISKGLNPLLAIRFTGEDIKDTSVSTTMVKKKKGYLHWRKPVENRACTSGIRCDTD